MCKRSSDGAQAHSGLRDHGAPLPFDLPALRYILAAAEFESFRAAADVYGTYPATVSRRIRKVEDALGISLFERGAAGVRLTMAGHRFVREAAAGLEQLSEAAKVAAASGRVEVGTVRIGVTTTLIGGSLRRLIADYKARHPGVAIELREGSRWDHFAGLRQRSLDVAFVTGVGEVPQCATKALWTERIHIAMASSHVLAALDHVEWECLKRERFIVTQFEPGPEIRDYILRRVSACGADAIVESKPVQRETLMHLVGLGEGVTAVSEACDAMSFPEVVLRPLTGDADIVTLSMVWAPGNDNPAVRRLVSRAHRLAGGALRMRPTAACNGISGAQAYPD